MITPKQMYIGQKLRFRIDQDAILQKCCGCGLWHEILIERDGEDLLITFNPLDGEPDPGKYAHTGTELIDTQPEDTADFCVCMGSNYMTNGLCVNCGKPAKDYRG